MTWDNCEPVLHRDDLEADSLAVYEPSAFDDTCMGNMFSDAVDGGAQECGTDINGGDSERDDSAECDSHGEATRLCMTRASTLGNC